jgi:hypothetical protein
MDWRRTKKHKTPQRVRHTGFHVTRGVAETAYAVQGLILTGATLGWEWLGDSRAGSNPAPSIPLTRFFLLSTSLIFTALLL